MALNYVLLHHNRKYCSYLYFNLRRLTTYLTMSSWPNVNVVLVICSGCQVTAVRKPSCCFGEEATCWINLWFDIRGQRVPCLFPNFFLFYRHKRGKNNSKNKINKQKKHQPNCYFKPWHWLKISQSVLPL